MASGYTNYTGTFLPLSAAYKTTIWASGTSTVTAGSSPTRLVGSGQGNVLIGGSADDTLGINNIRDRVTGGGGVDTAIATVDVVLPSDVENLTMDARWSPVFGIANNGANIVKAATANVTLDAKGGNDVIFSYGKNDTFIFEQGSGKDVIYNFHTGATDSDIARLEGYGFDSFSEVKAAMTQTGSDVLLKLSSSDAILFKNTTISAFRTENFEVSIDPSKLKMTFSDEFNALSLQNKSAGGGTWATSFAWDRYVTLSAHTIPSEQEVYVDPQFAGSGTTALGLNPFKVSNGVLTITPSATAGAVKSALWNYDYTSGLLTTKGSFAQQYGYFEMRADLPEAKGAFPAFWLLPADGSFTAEIDIMEYVGEANTVHNTVHYGPDGAHWTADSFKSYVADLASGFHTFGLRWTAQTLTWYVDGTQVAQVATPAGAQKPMYMLANYAVGGDWAGDIAANATLPGMSIDYIRAYSLDAAPASSPPPTDSSGGGTGSETIAGDSAANYLVGTSGADTITGGGGGDTLNGDGGTDKLVGGTGNDVYLLGYSPDTVVEAASQGLDTVKTGATYVLPANVENLTLTDWGRAVGIGNALNNVIVGNGGANYLDAGAGADTINGMAGADTIIGGVGADRLTGGGGGDTFVFRPGDGDDTIVDFAKSAGKLDLSDYLEDGLKPKLVGSGANTYVQFSNGDSINLLGVTPSHLSATTSGFIYV
ncbi:family 16 glycosylhydrolase [Phenylobacterium sp. LjRoot225]|uniref:family 16 glycosylhydrolase n=1 Tax=Phenylobacterium sp. LjRoot225 TaxID=3342285 RepID=UPI003ECEBC8B